MTQRVSFVGGREARSRQPFGLTVPIGESLAWEFSDKNLPIPRTRPRIHLPVPADEFL